MVYQANRRRRFGSPRSGATGTTRCPSDFCRPSAPRGAKAASPGILINHRAPSAAALHRSGSPTADFGNTP